ADKLAPKIYFENESHLPPKVRAEMRKILKGIERVFFDIIADAAKEGVFDVEPRLAAKHVMAVAAGPHRGYSEHGPTSQDEFADAAELDISLARSGTKWMNNAPKNAPGMVAIPPTTTPTTNAIDRNKSKLSGEANCVTMALSAPAMPAYIALTPKIPDL